MANDLDHNPLVVDTDATIRNTTGIISITCITVRGTGATARAVLTDGNSNTVFDVGIATNGDTVVVPFPEPLTVKGPLVADVTTATMLIYLARQ